MKVKVIYPEGNWGSEKTLTFDVGEVEAESHIEACEEMFKAFNNVIENPFEGEVGWLSAKHDCRSLSVGDIVEVDGIRYRCENIGWLELSESAS